MKPSREHLARIENFIVLSKNWDSFEAEPYTYAMLNHTKETLNILTYWTQLEPSLITPTSASGIQFKYSFSHLSESIEVEIHPNQKTYSVLFPNDVNYEEVSLERICRSICDYLQEPNN